MKAFLNEQCNEIGENKIRKNGDIQGPFQTRMGTIKDRNGKDLTEAEVIKKRRQEYTEELYRKTIEWETSDLFKKIGDIRGIFHVRMGMIKDRNSMDLTEAEEIKKVKVGLRKHCCSVTYLSDFL